MRNALPACLLAAAGLLLPACTAAEMAPEPTEKQDDAARLAHYEESAQTYYDGARYEQAAAQWRKVLELQPNHQKARWGLAKSLANTGTAPNLREAEQIFAEIVNLDWSHPTRGDIRFEVLRDFGQVYLDLADLYDKDVRSLEAQIDARAVPEAKGRAEIERETRMRDDLLSKAIPLFEQVLERSRENPYALAGLAKSHLLVGDPMRGVSYARRYVALSEESQRGWEAELKQYEEDLGKARSKITDNMRKLYREKIRGAREKEIGMRLLIAAVLMRTGDPAGAEVEFDRVLALDPARPAAYLERAQARAAAGRFRPAMLDLEKYLQVTDPVKQHESRIKAAGLLETYRLSAAKASTPPPPAAAPAPAPAPRVPAGGR
jgi:Tfp pilus assembly protein PilF